MSGFIGSLIFCGVAGCLAPEEPPARPDLTITTDGECARISFQISGSSVTTWYPQASCTLGLVVIKASGATTWTPSTRTLVLKMRVVNTSGLPVTLPVRLDLPAAGRTVTLPEGISGDSLVPQNMDSSLAGGRVVWLVGGTGTLEPGDSSGVKELAFTVKAPVTKGRFWFVSSGEEIPQVPLVAPDSVPAWFLNDSSWVGPQRRGFLKRVVLVRFHSWATHADRQQAIDLVDGIVVGGVRGGLAEGSYYVRIDDDGTGQQLLQAAHQLQSLPQVRMAGLFAELKPMGRRPNDSTEWKRGDWSMSPAQSQGNNWILEDVAAPLAWGCTVGDSSTRLGIVDHDFDTLDLSANLAAPVPSIVTQETGDHGFQTATLVAARGDNGFRTAGVMWIAALSLHEINPVFGGDMGTDRVVAQLLAAGRSGARVISLAWGVAEPSGKGASIDSALAALTLAQLKEAMDTLATEAAQGGPSLPLLVVAAGNFPWDASFSGAPRLREAFPDNVIVAGGTGFPLPAMAPTARAVYPGLNYGPLVDIWAPGEWNFINSVGQNRYETGSSISAAIVAGIAGLLQSFDPTLTSAQTREFLVDGAANGFGGQGTIVNANGSTGHLANAYESLKLAAARPGAGLCGNIVFPQGTLIRVLRGSTVETLLDAQTNVFSVSVPHGGRTVSYTTAAGSYTAVRGPGGWATGPAPNPFPPPSGFAHSLFALSHDADSVAFLDPQPDGSVLVWVDAQENSTGARQIGVIPALPRSSAEECVQRVYAKDAQGNPITNPPEYDCVRSDSVANMGSPRVADYLPLTYSIAYSPFGDRILVSVPGPATQYASTGWYGAPIEPLCPAGSQCQRFHFTSSIPSSQVHSFAVSGGGGLLWTINDVVRGLAVADDGDQVYYQGFPFSTAWQWTWPQGPDVNYPPGAILGQCTLNVRRLAGGSTATHALGNSCYDQQGAVAPVSAHR